MVEEEISIEEFRSLSEVLEKAKTSEEEVLALISDKAMSTNAIASALGLSYSAIYARLTRMLKNGKIEKRYKGGTAFWLVKQ